jgi:hypothetical protein
VFLNAVYKDETSNFDRIANSDGRCNMHHPVSSYMEEQDIAIV